MRSHLDDLALVDALRARITEMQQRLARLETRAEKKRELVTLTMDQADIRKIVEPDITVSLRTGPPSLIVTDEQTIPKGFWKEQPAKLDRQQLTKSLKSGQEVPGATLGKGKISLSVRTK